MDPKSDIYAKAFAELASIDSQIAALENRRSGLRQFVELGQRLFVTGHAELTAPMATVEAGGSLSERPASTTPREQSLKARVLALSKQAIQDRGPQPTSALVEYVEAAGVIITGVHKPTTVSVILSRSAEFKSDRTQGWSLLSPQEKTPQDVTASAGSPTAKAVSAT